MQTAVKSWQDHTGGRMGHGKLGSHLKPLVEEHGEGEVLNRLARYLDATEAKYASVGRFAETFGAWTANGRKPKGRGRGYQDPAAGIDYAALARELGQQEEP